MILLFCLADRSSNDDLLKRIKLLEQELENNIKSDIGEPNEELGSQQKREGLFTAYLPHSCMFSPGI